MEYNLSFNLLDNVADYAFVVLSGAVGWVWKSIDGNKKKTAENNASISVMIERINNLEKGVVFVEQNKAAIREIEPKLQQLQASFSIIDNLRESVIILKTKLETTDETVSEIKRNIRELSESMQRHNKESSNISIETLNLINGINQSLQKFGDRLDSQSGQIQSLTARYEDHIKNKLG